MEWTRSTFLQFVTMAGFSAMPLLSGGNNQPSYELSVEKIAELWRISADMALEFAEAMPEAEYDYRPVNFEQMYTFGGQMLHIAHNNVNLISRHVTDQHPPDLPDKADYLSRDAIMEAMNQSFTYGKQAILKQSRTSLMQEITFFSVQVPRWQVIFVAQDHTTHHLGQAVVYLRGRGIEPPDYRKW